MENQRIQIIPYKQYFIERDCYNFYAETYEVTRKGIKISIAAELVRNGYGEFIRRRIAELRLAWEDAIRPYIGSRIVERYHSGEIEFEDIKQALKSLIYDMASRFAFEERKMFIRQERKLGLTTDPFRFDDVELNRQADRTILEALSSYDPARGTKFSTHFYNLFEKDLLDLYKTYKGKPLEVKDKDHFEELGLTWTDTFVSIPDLTSIPVDDLTVKEQRWMSLVLETPPWYVLNAICRAQIMGYKSDEPDRKIREGLRKKLSGYDRKKGVKMTSDIYGDPDLPDPTAEVVFRIVAGEIPTYKPDRLVKTKPSTITGTKGIIITPKEFSPPWNTGYCDVCGFSLTTDKKCSNTNVCKTYLTENVIKRLKIE